MYFLQAASSKNAQLQSASLQSGPPYFCPHCDFKTQRQPMFCRHMKSHLFCNKCEKSFKGNNSRRNLQSHMRSHGADHNKKQIQVKEVKTPKFEIKEYVCLNCDKSYPFKSYLERHMNISHCKYRVQLSKPEFQNSDTDSITKNLIKVEVEEDRILNFLPESLKSKEDPMKHEHEQIKNKRKQKHQPRHSL